MALLSSENRDRICRWFQRRNTQSCSFTKGDLRAAVDATDSWIDSNSSSYNQSLPVAFRTGASADQKTILFCYVAMRRAGLLRVEEDG